MDVCGALAAGIRPVWLNRFKHKPGVGAIALAIAGFDDVNAAVVALLEPTGHR